MELDTGGEAGVRGDYFSLRLLFLVEVFFGGGRARTLLAYHRGNNTLCVRMSSVWTLQ